MKNIKNKILNDHGCYCASCCYDNKKKIILAMKRQSYKKMADICQHINMYDKLMSQLFEGDRDESMPYDIKQYIIIGLNNEN